MIEDREKRNRRIALMGTIGINALVFIFLFFAIAWRAPDPPLPEYGIELNFGMDDEGSGDIQPLKPVGEQVPEEEPQKPEPQEEEIKVEEKTQESETVPVEQAIVQKEESPVVVKEVKKEKPVPVEKPIEKPKEKPVEKPVEKPKEDPKAVYKPSTGDVKTSQSKTGEPGSQGDGINKTGDKGSPEGTLDANALYGKPGGGGNGTSLDITGWEWDEIPKPKVPDNESGRIVLEIEVNSDGEVIRINTLEKSIGSEAERVCKEAVQKLTFSRKPGAKVPPITKGKITFVVRAR